MDEDQKEKKLFDRRERDENFGGDWVGRLHSAVWDFLEYPETSKLSQLFHSASIFFVMLSTLTFLVESCYEADTATADVAGDTALILQVLKYVDMVSLVFFTAEFLLRLVFSPNKRHFIRDPLNFVDFISIAPFYLALLLEEFQDLQIIGKAGKQFRFLRFMRILRIFKMVRHFVGLQSLIYTIYQAYKVDNM